MWRTIRKRHFAGALHSANRAESKTQRQPQQSKWQQHPA
jgi:hypothetical protein